MHPLDTAPFLFRLVGGAIAAGVTWVFAIDAGDVVLAGLRVPRGATGRGAAAAAIGYALLGSIAAIWGLLHIASPLLGLFLIIVTLLIAIEHRASLRTLPASIRAWSSRMRSLPIPDLAALGVAALAVVTAIVAAALPASWWDPIAYHLPIVARAVAQHTFSFDPAMVQTGFPLLAEAAALPAYTIAGSAGAALTTLGAGIVLALLCGAWAESIASGAGRLAGALVACSALWLWLAPSFYVDVPYAMFAIAALGIAYAVVSRPDAWGRGALAAGLLAGAAASTKYPGLFIAVLACAILLVGVRRAGARSIGSFVLAGIVIAAGWYVRSFVLTGDPLYPLLAARGVLDAPIHDFAQRYATMTQTWCGSGTTLADAVALPWNLLSQPRTFCGDAGYALDLGAIFVVASVALWRRTAVTLALVFALTAFWFFTSQQWRFLLPAASLFAVLAAAGAVAATARLRPAATAALLVLGLANVAVDWLPNPGVDASNSIAPGYSYIAGRETADDYLSQRLESYDAARWLRTHDGRVRAGALDDVRDYYFGLDTVWLNPFYQSAFALDWQAPAQARYGALEAAGMRYLIVNADEAYTSRTPTGVDWSVLASDVRSGAIKPVFSHDGVTVYALHANAPIIKR
jgi:hypothetical protein